MSHLTESSDGLISLNWLYRHPPKRLLNFWGEWNKEHSSQWRFLLLLLFLLFLLRDEQNFERFTETVSAVVTSSYQTYCGSTSPSFSSLWRFHLEMLPQCPTFMGARIRRHPSSVFLCRLFIAEEKFSLKSWAEFVIKEDALYGLSLITEDVSVKLKEKDRKRHWHSVSKCFTGETTSSETGYLCSVLGCFTLT